MKTQSPIASGNGLGALAISALAGAQTAPESHIDTDPMLDLGSLTGLSKKTWLAGVEYEYWHNKFGNDGQGPAGEGATASTPMVRVEYHF